jgi:predicted RNA-binding Zn-ribbon protein involved in translation (DUF1610 family)
MSRKVNLEKVQASLDAVCPKCGKAISPAEVRRVDFEHIECPACAERFVSQAIIDSRREKLIFARIRRSCTIEAL